MFLSYAFKRKYFLLLLWFEYEIINVDFVKAWSQLVEQIIEMQLVDEWIDPLIDS
jgi:hypothetical protein